MFCQLSFDSSLCRIKAAVKIQLGRGKEEDKDTEDGELTLNLILVYLTKRMHVSIVTGQSSFGLFLI